jgi:hypothetical protein
VASQSGERARRVLREFLAAILWFLTGVAFLLLTAFGQVYWGAAFDGAYLKWIGAGLIIVSVYVVAGVSLPRLLQGHRDVGPRRDDDDDDAE